MGFGAAAVTDFSGTFIINGQPVSWRSNPLTGGWYLDLVTDTIQLRGAPNGEMAEVAMAAYQQGVSHGERLGRAKLQNDFRNLMECQPR